MRAPRLALVLSLSLLCGCVPGGGAAGHPPAGGRGPTYTALARRALETLERGYYDGAGGWHMCLPVRCYTDRTMTGAPTRSPTRCTCTGC